MTPAEAGALEFEEPDWQERFEEHALRWPKMPLYLAQDNAFEATLKDWRKFHAIPLEGGKSRPAPAVDGVIALAQLRIFPARFQTQDIPRSDETGYQADDHMWLSVAGEQWRIATIADRTMILEQYYGAKPTTMQIDLTRAKWGNYCKAAAAVLETMGGPYAATLKDPPV